MQIKYALIYRVVKLTLAIVRISEAKKVLLFLSSFFIENPLFSSFFTNCQWDARYSVSRPKSTFQVEDLNHPTNFHGIEIYFTRKKMKQSISFSITKHTKKTKFSINYER
jgi:hypothetical protein